MNNNQLNALLLQGLESERGDDRGHRPTGRHTYPPLEAEA